MHDYTGVLLKIQNDEGVVFTYEVDEYGEIFRTVTVEPISNYRHEGFAQTATYTCECGMEYYIWDDMAEHLAMVAEEEKNSTYIIPELS
jgi:hypothetical protein